MNISFYRTPQLATTTRTVRTSFADGKQNNLTTIAANGCTITRYAGGRYSVVFDTPHPDGAAYAVVFGLEESGTARAVPKASVIAGSQTANGFNVQVTVDDNGAAADGFSTDVWSFAVFSTVQVVSNVALS